MKRLLTLALVLGTLASAFATSALTGTRVMAPPPPSPQTQTIILNSGYDQWLASPALIAVGQKDNEWRVITDTVNGVPDPLIATGRPADVVSNNIWGVFQDANFPNSRWISIGPNQGAPLPTPPNQFQYAYYFTLPVGFSNPVLTMKLSSDDHITKVTLNSHTLFQGSGGIFINPPLMIPTLANPTTLADFMSGSDVNVLTVDVEDTAGGITGLIVDGTVTYQDCDRLPVKDIPGLDSITFWESTFAAPTQHTFAAAGPELTTRLNPLDSSNNDFVGAPGLEFYDVFYSDWNGAPNPTTGQFVTIEAAVPTIGYPSGGGLNIARVDFNGTGQSANSVSSFVCLGNNALPVKVGKAVDFDPGVPQTDTTMGNTIGQTQRLRLTVGFPCCTPPPPNMVAWWPLDEVSGATSLQDIIGGNNATPFASPVGAAQAPQPVSGVVNGAIQFPKFGNALSQAFVAPQGALVNIGSAEFTIDAWVEFPSAAAGRLHYIVNKFDTQQNKGYALYVLSPGIAGNERLEFQWGDGATVSTVQTISPLTPNQWHHVAVTFARNVGGNPLDIRLYVDGSQQGHQVGGNPGLGSLVNSIFLEIGSQPGSIDEPITLDELEIFSRPLAASEINTLFNAGSAGKCKPCATPPPDMVAWWPADGNANDITPSPDNGTLNGGATFAPGEVAQAFSLNGTTAYVSAPDVPKINFGTGDFSIDAWIKTSNTDDVRVIVDKRVGKNGTTFTGYSFFTFNGNLAVQLADGTFLNFISTTNVADGAFHHVAVTVVRTSTTGGNLYVDGVPVFNFNPKVRPGSLTNSAELRIGRRSPNTGLGAFFNGLIDEVELFNRALSTTEVQGIFLARSRGKCKCTSACPANITKANDPNQCGAVVTYPDPIASQVCGTAICSPPSGSFFPKGATTVTCSTTAGQSCTFTVTVNDTQPPTISASAVVVLIGAGSQCSRAYFGVTASDNCPAVTKICTPPSGTCFPVGTTTVTCTATDSSGNTATTSFTVTIPNPFDPH
jgi:concanavalin A-like lectin/glucanase superfamily protein/HYR domain-containing protein